MSPRKVQHGMSQRSSQKGAPPRSWSLVGDEPRIEVSQAPLESSPERPLPAPVKPASLQSGTSKKRLEQIASLRSLNIGERINLPQVVVCGDQSTGKSSVLEGLTEIPFPRQEGICTRFATQIIIEQTEDASTSIEASIVPHSLRDEKQKEELAKFRRTLDSFSALADTISDAGKAMGIRGVGGNTVGSAFAFDILSIKVSGPTGMCLMVVDLPGLIATTSDVQTEHDKQMVHELVERYLQNTRTIILAVIQAGNDVANQTIIQKARDFDKSGQRTVGIITKPDLINKGSESRIAQLAKNQDTTKLKLGWFLLKNPDPLQMSSNPSFEQRRRIEEDFFKEKNWKDADIDPKRVGIMSLRSFVTDILDKHIERELPAVRDEIKKLWKRASEEVRELGMERISPASIRMYLSGLSTKIHGRITAGLNGSYLEAEPDFFAFSDGNHSRLSTRLRAVVHKENKKFSDDMAENGRFRRVGPEDSDAEALSDDAGPYYVLSKAKMKEWVQEIYESTRGPELPGTYNHVLLSELFHEQSCRWRTIAQSHIETTQSQIEAFVRNVLQYDITDEDTFQDILEEAQTALEAHKSAAFRELDSLWNDERGHPITYNHYYIDNVQKSRQDIVQKALGRSIDSASRSEYEGDVYDSRTDTRGFSVDKFLERLKSNFTTDMTDQACEEALEGLHSYYKVALKTWVDNVCRQVIERHLLRNLPGVFGPERVAGYSDEDLQRIAGERPQRTERRKELQAMLVNLDEALEVLKR